MRNRIGIITLHRNTNYGANLQAYACCQFLLSQGYDVQVIDYLPRKYDYESSLGRWLRESWKNDKNRSLLHKIKLLISLLVSIAWKHRRVKSFNSFRRHNIRLSSYCSSAKDIAALGIDTVICGSDQIWNPVITGGINPVYFGAISGVTTRISYAASMGKACFDEGLEHHALIADIDYCSVREEETKEYAEKISGRSVSCVCDPVFLLDKTVYESMSGKRPVIGKYLLLYSIVPNDTMLKIAREYATEHNLKLIEICAGKQRNSTHRQITELGPAGFLNYFYHADAIITNSFHGTAFSIILEKHFYAVNNRGGGSRIFNLLEKAGLQNRMIESIDDIYSCCIDYAAVRKKMASYISGSKDFLLSAVKTNKKVVAGENCVGCGACKNICPSKAIKLFPDRCGFDVAWIDKNKCLNCGLCMKACPSMNEPAGIAGQPEVFAFKAKDDVRRNSTSGGAFSALASVVLNHGGTVYAAAWCEDGRVAHRRCSSVAELQFQQGVKYVQSDFSVCYEYVTKDLLAGKTVLVTGTPCQIAAMKRYVAIKDIPSEKLFFADIICHGIPSPLFFNDYRKWVEKKYGSCIKKYRFRDKDIAWRGHSCSVELTDGRRIENSRELCSYMNVYYSGNITRKSCFECKYTSVSRLSDITVSDYWGLENFAPDFEDPLGVSMVLVNTEKGSELFSVADGARIGGSLAAARQPQLSRPCERPETWEQFWCDYYKKDAEVLLKKHGGLQVSKIELLKTLLHRLVENNA